MRLPGSQEATDGRFGGFVTEIQRQKWPEREHCIRIICYNGGLNMKQKVIIKNAHGYYDGVRNFIVIPVADDTRRELSDFCEVPDTSEILFTISKYATIGAADGLSVDGFTSHVGAVTLSVKLEATEYDWAYKGKKGHTKKWQVCGVLFKTPLIDGNMEGLDDD